MFLTLSTPELLCEEPSADWLIYHTPPVISRGFYYMTWFAAQNQASVSGHFRYRSEFLKVLVSERQPRLWFSASYSCTRLASSVHISQLWSDRCNESRHYSEYVPSPRSPTQRGEHLQPGRCFLAHRGRPHRLRHYGAHQIKKNQGLHLPMDALDWKNASIYFAWTSLALTYVAFSRCK